MQKKDKGLYISIVVVWCFIVGLALTRKEWGHLGDHFYCFKIWIEDYQKYGITLHSWINYFPLGRYFFWVFSTLVPEGQVLEHMYKIKFFNLVADLLSIFIFISLIKGKVKNWHPYVYFILLNPAYWYSSLVWGQHDSQYVLVLMGTIWALVNKKHRLFVCLAVIGLNMKPQFIAFSPILFTLFFIVYRLPLKNVLYDFAYGFIVEIIILSPFIILRFPDYHALLSDIDRLYIYPLRESHNVLSVSSLNVYTLLFGSGAFTASCLENVPYLSISFKMLGIIVFGCTELFTIALLYIKRKEIADHILEYSVFTLCLICCTFYLFATNMHERYLQPLICLLPVLIALKKFPKILYIFFSAIFLFTLTLVMKGSPGQEIFSVLGVFEQIPVQVISLFFISVWFYLVYVFVRKQKI